MKKLYVQSIIDYIEEHIEEPVSLDLIASRIGYSKFYLHKLFYIYTGMLIMDYARKRKLEHSLQDLNSDSSIMDIAVKYSFSSDRTYSRAFKKVYGISPSKYRNNACVLTPKLILNQLGGIKMLSYLSETKEVTVDKMYALTYSAISKEPEADSIDFLTDYCLDKRIVPYSAVGFDIPVTEEQSELGLRGYQYWVVVDQEIYRKKQDDVVEKREVEKGKYLMVTIEDPFVDPFERIPNGWKKVWADAEQKYSFRDGLGFYGFEEKVDTLHKTFMNIYVPIE